MKIGFMLGLGAVAVAAVAVAAMPIQDAKAKTRDDKAAHGGMDAAAMAAAMKLLGAPGPEHAEMKKMVGTWDVQSKCWMDPSQPPEESHGTAVFAMSNDRFVTQNYTGTMMGQPYEGVGLMAFNNATKQYENVWRDNSNTGLMWSTGTKGADGSITLKGKSNCVMGEMDCRMVQTMKGDNAMHFEMYCTMAGHPESKMMELDYTRGGGR